MYRFYNPNPVRSGVGDCAVRAIAKALGMTWERAYTELSFNGFLMGDVMNSDTVWGALLREHGFRRVVIPNSCPDCYTVAEFADDHPSGIYVVKSPNHVATVVDGVLYDSWDSSEQTAIYYWTKG